MAEIAERWTLEAILGERSENRHDIFRVMPVRRRDIGHERDATFVYRNRDFDATNLPSGVDTTIKAARARSQDRLSITTVLGSGQSPQARQSRRSRAHQRSSRVERANSLESVPNGMSQSSSIARHFTETNTSESPSWPCAAPLRPAAALPPIAAAGHHPLRWPRVQPDLGPRTRQHRQTHPLSGKRLCRTDGGSHVLALMLDPVGSRLYRRRSQFYYWL